MGLPISVCPTAEVELPSGAIVKIRGLSRAEALLARAQMPDVDKVEKLSLGFACDATESEVAEWYVTARNDDVAVLIDAIADLSGLSAEAGKAAAED